MRRLIFSSVLIVLCAKAGWPQTPDTPLTLERAIDTYIANNLELQAATYRVERTRADRIAARLRINPGLIVTGENLKFTGPVPFSQLYEVAASYSETIELGGKRKLRQSVADLTVAAAEAQFSDTMRRGLAEVKRLYYEALLAKYLVDIATENRQTFEQLLQFNVSRFQEGAIPEADLIRVRLERIKFDTAVSQAALGLKRTTIRLLERLGESVFTTQTLVGEMNFALIDPGLESLRQTALNERSDVQAANRELDAASERLALELARSKSDITPFVGYKRLASDNTVLFGFSMPLKVRDRNEAGIARAQADQKAAQLQVRLARNRALAEVESAYAGFQAARQQIEAFRNELLDEADESRSIALAAYQEGATQLLPLLDAQRTRTEVRQQYFRTLFDYEVARVDLELAVGKDFAP
jgi:cobalt-zinc-cadmium efflux system outer membrane protein